MRKLITLATIATLLGGGTALAAGMSKEDYKAARKRVAAEAEAERKKCGVRYGTALDFCVAKARGDEKVARAELEATYKPSPKTNYDAAIARANRDEAVAKAECEEKPRDMRKACVKDAKAAAERARVDAQAARKLP